MSWRALTVGSDATFHFVLGRPHVIGARIRAAFGLRRRAGSARGAMPEGSR